MPNCSIIGCGMRNGGNITVHQLPKKENKKTKWLNIIGKGNLNPFVKTIYICSLHFEASSFNRTLDVTTLRDDAAPSYFLLPPDRPSIVMTETIEEQLRTTTDKPSAGACSSVLMTRTNQDKLRTTTDMPPASSSNFVVSSGINEGQLYTATDMVGKGKSLETLKNTCEIQRKKIKRLHEKLRRHEKRIANYVQIIKNLKANNLVKSRPKSFFKKKDYTPKKS